MSETEAIKKFQKELNAGTLALLALSLVVKSRRPMYGYQIGMQLAGLSDDDLPMNQGALYPVLRSLERSGLLESYVEPSASGPPRKYYSPTDSGRRALKEWKQAWRRTQSIVNLVLEQKHVDGSKHSKRNSEIS